ncbi:hypothetical protein JCM10908_002796 [Rhodotorula pacifica]|uniref:uncharacterized protein n=1 Tax=Rhodotorula pacifica TaxID=1495444 RepID=UPI00317F8C76
MTRAVGARAYSLVILCFLSTLLGILIHRTHAQHRPERAAPRPSSLILVTELLKLAVLLGLAAVDSIGEKAKLAGLLWNLPIHESRRDSGHAEAVAASATAQQQLPAPCLPPPPAIDSVYAVRQTSAERRATLPEPEVEVLLDAPLTPLVELFPVKVHCSPLMKRSSLPNSATGKVTLPPGADLETREQWAHRAQLGVVSTLMEDIFSGDWWMLAIPAVLYAVQNNLLYVAARILTVPVFQILLQLRPPVTALCAMFILGRRVAALQWIALVVLGLGIVCMHVGAVHHKSGREYGLLHYGLHDGTASDHAPGLLAAIVSCFAGAVAASSFEYTVKQRHPLAPSPLPPSSHRLWIRCIQLSIFSCLLGLGMSLLQGDRAHVDAISNIALGLKNLHDPLQPWYAPVTSLGGGFFDGFTPSTWLIAIVQALTGVAIAAAIQHADTLAKEFTLAVSVVVAFAFALVVEIQPVPTVSYFGATAIVLAALSYRSAGASPAFRMEIDRARVTFAFLVAVGIVYLLSLPSGDGFAVRATVSKMPAYASSLGKALLPTGRPASPAAAPNEAALAVDTRPSVAIVDMTLVNEPLAAAASGVCGLGAHAYRESTWSPFGFPVTVPPDYPYWVMKTDQYALDDILTTKFATYERSVPLLSTPPPDFLFMPVLSEVWANAWGCKAPEWKEAAARTTQFLRDLAKSVGDTDYPPIVLPIATIRSNLDWVFTPELMDELKDKVVLVSIENAPKDHNEGFKYLIDVPYPTSFHLSARIPGKKTSLNDYFLNAGRPYLIHYGAGQTHPWGKPSSDPFNGFASRAALGAEIRAYQEAHAGNKTAPKIMWDDITDSVEQAQNLSPIHAHMEQAIFCLMPAGDSPSRRAFYEAIQLGCIPVVFREKSYGRLFPSTEMVNDISRYTVFIDETAYLAKEGPAVIEQLTDISLGEIRAKQEYMLKVAPKLQWALPELDEWIPLTSRRDAVPIAGMQVWNRTIALERMKDDEPLEDAFALLLKELTAIRDGHWRGGHAKDLRRGLRRLAVGKVNEQPPADEAE